MNIKNKKILTYIGVFVLGCLVTFFVTGSRHNNENQINMSLFWRTWETLEEKYPFQEPSNQDKVFSAIEGLVQAYDDDHSAFLPPVKNEFFDQNISGEFGGIGAEIDVRRGYLVIISPLKNSPAENAGLRAGDIITEVDQFDIDGLTLDQAIGLIRGEKGTNVTLTILREGEQEPLSITITRDTVQIPILETEIRDDVFIVHLYNFNDRSSEAFKDALVEFKESGSEKLLIDVRNNPGGFLVAVIDMLSYMTEQGTILLREQTGPLPEDETVYRSLGYSLLEDSSYEISVLVNEGSASASEIMAGALRDILGATIVGETSYGKGSVQELINLPQDTALKITIAKWLTPNSNEIDGQGIVPDVYIELDPESEIDVQLEKAIESLQE